MKKIVFVFLLLTQVIFAETLKDTLKLPLAYKSVLLPECDACGCSASGGGMGFNSLIATNFIGVRYFYQAYETKTGPYGNSPWADDTFNSISLQARFSPFKRVEFMAQTLYNYNQRSIFNDTEKISGIGDALVLGFYTILNSMDQDSLFLNHKVNVGGGVKIPLGKFTPINTDGNNPAFQLGTGSWDYVAALEYTIKHKKLGLSNMLTYNYKTENKDRYQFGNQVNYGSAFFYSFYKANWIFMPQVGFSGETYKANRDYGYEVKNSAGDIFFGKLAFDVAYKNWSVSMNFFSPINQNLMNGNLVAENRFSIQLNYAL